jgi:cytochrome c5
MSKRFWILAVFCLALLGVLWRASEVAAHPAALRSEHSEPAKTLPAQQVAIIPGGKQFHDPHCRYIHGKPVMVDPKTAAAEGYTPDPRCLKQAMQ